MSYEQADRDPFEVFGEADESREIELTATVVELTPDHVEAHPANDIAAAPEIKTGFSWAAFAGGLASVLWIAAAIGGPISYYGVDGVMRMDPALQAGIAALALGPALLFWLGAAAAGEALKARKLGTELARLAHLSQLPVEIGEHHAKRLTLTVKNEIDALNDAVASALNRLAELETVAQRNASLFDSAVTASRENTDVMTGALARERNALVELSGELRGQTETMANSIGRQVRLMREASKLVKTEITAAEDALESHLASFAASASVMAERTASFHQVADSASHATSSLNSTMHNMLDGLGQATKLTDAARQSAAQAVLAANETASAVRETTQKAVVEAKRAAQVIRAETAALQDVAADTLARLQGAADAARAASEESQAAADRHAASIEKRLAALASTAGAIRKPAAPQPQAQPQARVAERPVERKPVATPVPAPEGLLAAADAAVARSARPQVRAEVQAAPRTDRFGNAFKGLGSWGNFLPPQREDDLRRKAANQPEEANAFDLVDFKPAERKNPDVELKNDVLDLVAAAGVDLDDALAAADLERIAQSSQQGANARRRAVAEAAPSAVNRIARHMKRNNDAKLVAAEFRARPDLAKSEKKGEASDLVRAYLLIDAALD